MCDWNWRAGHVLGRAAMAWAGLVQSGLSYAGPEILVDRIEAVVNSSPVLHSEVQDKVRNGPLVMVSDYPLDEKAPAEQRSLQDKINTTLIMQRAQELDIQVADDQVDREIDQFLKARGLDRQGLMQFLQEQGRTFESYRADFRDQMILGRFQGRVIHPLVKITERDLETYFLKQSGGGGDWVEVSLRQLVIRIPAGSSPEIVEAKKKMIGEAFRRLQEGTSFEDVARLYADSRASADPVTLKLRDLNPTIRSAIQSLEVNQVSVPVEMDGTWSIFQLTGKAMANSAEFAKARERIEFELRNQELSHQTRRWLVEERQRSKVAVGDEMTRNPF